MMEEETVLKDAYVSLRLIMALHSIAEQRNLYLNSTAEFEALFERLQEQIGHLESEIENRAALTNPSVTLLNEAVKTATEGLTRAKRATEGAGVADADVRAMKVLMGLGPAKRRTVRGI